MKITDKHSLYQPEITDDIVLTIEKYGENFEKIDDLIPESVSNLNLHLVVGDTYNLGKIIYNSIPTSGGYVGWINIKEGIHAKDWRRNTTYNVNDIVLASPNNGYCYRCVTSGMSAPIQPTFPTTLGAQVDDAFGLMSWTPSKPYAVGDIVKSTSGGSTYYYRCTIAGTSDINEPNWTTNSGTLIIDGTVSWIVCKKAIWEQIGTASEFRPFGKIE